MFEYFNSQGLVEHGLNWLLVRQRILWFLHCLKKVMSFNELSTVIGRVSPWDHHGYYRLMGQKPEFVLPYAVDYIELILFHEFFPSDVRSFSGGHVLLFYKWNKMDDDAKVADIFMLMLMNTLSLDQKVWFIPCEREVGTEMCFNSLGNKKWTLIEPQAVRVEDCSTHQSWCAEFDTVYDTLRMLTPHMTSKGLHFFMYLPKHCMPYVRIAILPENVFKIYHSIWYNQNLDFEVEDANLSLVVEIWASYHPFNMWTEMYPSSPHSFCHVNGFYNDFGIEPALKALELDTSRNAFRWMLKHLLVKSEMLHYENEIFKDPMKSLRWVKPCLNELCDIPKFRCGKLVNWECHPFSLNHRDAAHATSSRIKFDDI